MRLTNNTTYIETMKELEASFSAAHKNNALDKVSLGVFQEKLDGVADKYQESDVDEKWLMYFLQARISYLAGDKDTATRFLKAAVEDRGDEWEAARDLQKKLRLSIKRAETPSVDVRSELYGIKGWLLVPVIGLVFMIIYFLYGLLNSILIFESMIDGVFIAFLLAFAISSFIGILLGRAWAKITYTYLWVLWAGYLFLCAFLYNAIANDLYNADYYFGQAFMSVVVGTVWVAYMFTSKRVKVTLNK